MSSESENKILIEAVRVSAERIEQLTSGPGGIMEMKQTIADLEKYRDMVHFIANDYIELSYEKAQCQRDDWYKRCNKTITGIENNGI